MDWEEINLLIGPQKKILGIKSNGWPDIQSTLFSYFRKMDFKPNETRKDQLKGARNLIVRSIIDYQLATTGHFKIPKVNGVCPKCFGTGEIYKIKELIPRQCSNCKGTGKVSEPCHSNHLKRSMCQFCRNTGAIHKNCPVCFGSGIEQTERKRLIGYFSCFLCLGEGRTNKFFNPVIKDRFVYHITRKEKSK